MTTKKIKDHREIGRELDLFMFHEYAPGAVFWLPRGMVIFKELEKYIREITEKAGYQETSTPIMIKSQLFEQSGHWEKFGEHNMYNLILSDDEDDRKPIQYSLKPMNCPESTIIFMSKQRSYRELPLRFSELGRLHRREKSGEINGLLRVRQLTMDDAHIFCTEEQIFDEVSNILDTMIDFYKKFGFEYEFRFATRPEQRAGTDEMWDEAEKDLEEVLKRKSIKASDKKGDGAFYGPKVDMHIKDAHGRDWQLATVQLDFHQPKALEVEYVDKNGQRQIPVMIHRAIFGSFERFIAVLTEHFQGAFPVWLAPVQAIVLPLSDKFSDYGQKIASDLRLANIRVEVDKRNETLQAKIRDATVQKIPYLLIVGAREKEKQAVAVRTREGEDQGQAELQKFKLGLLTKIADKS